MYNTIDSSEKKNLNNSLKPYNPMSKKNDRIRKGGIRRHFSIYRAYYGALIILGFVVVDFVLFPELLGKTCLLVYFLILMMTVELWWPALKAIRLDRQARAGIFEAGEDRAPEDEKVQNYDRMDG
jgi:hypothetical protein